MFKDKEKQREYNRQRMQRTRVTQKVTQVPEDVLPDTPVLPIPVLPTDYPPVINALADMDKRAKLRAICQSLGSRGLLREVRYGVEGPTFDVVAECLECVS